MVYMDMFSLSIMPSVTWYAIKGLFGTKVFEYHNI
jgi:hypothetical protein